MTIMIYEVISKEFGLDNFKSRGGRKLYVLIIQL